MQFTEVMPGGRGGAGAVGIQWKEKVLYAAQGEWRWWDQGGLQGGRGMQEAGCGGVFRKRAFL